MSDLTIKVSPRIYQIKEWYEVGPRILKREFGYYKREDLESGDRSPMFIKVRGTWIDVSEFQRIPNGAFPMGPNGKPWDGYENDTYFSGTLIQFVDSECEEIRVGRCYS